LILIISGCNFDSNIHEPNEFIEYLYSNPIDRDMKKDEEKGKIYRTKDIYKFYMNYYNIWNNEMGIVYENLIDLLDDEAKTLLENSQIAWEDENINNSKLWSYVFDMSKGHGSGDSTMILLQSIDRIRIRTFLLAEYYYWTTNDFKFAYQ